MSQIYYENLDITLANDIRNTKTNLDTHVTKVASATELGHVKIDDSTIKINPSGQLYSTSSGGNVPTGVTYYQYTLPTTIVGQKSWDIPLATFDPTKDLIIVTHNTTILSDQMYNITSLGNTYSLNITEDIPTAIASNNVFIIILQGKVESPVVPTDLVVDNTTIVKEDNTLKAINIKGLTVPTANINEYLTGTTSNIQTQINSIQTTLSNTVGGVNYLGRFETYAELNGVVTKKNGDMAVVLADETKAGTRTLYIYSDPLVMWQFVGAFEVGGGSQFSDTFIDLLDTPASFLGASGKNVVVNVAGNGLEFADADYNKLINKPTSTVSSIDSAVINSHTHTNKAELDRLGINLSNRLTIDGVDYVVDAIGSAVDSAKMYVDSQLATHDSKNATTTSKGHVQIGSGIDVVDGVISVAPTTVPDATKTTKGKVQVGNGIEVTNGVISVNPTPDASALTKGLVQIGEGLTSTSGLVNVNTATTTSKGIMQVGSGLSVLNGVVSANTTPDATTTSKGLVQVGSGINVTGGVISVTPIPDATNASKGIVQVGSGLNVSGGIVSAPNATTTTKGIMQVGEGLNVIDGVVSIAPTYTNSFDITTPYESFPFGSTLTPISTNATMENYRKLTALTNQLLGYTLDVNTSTVFRYTMQTVKVVGASYQKIDVFYNYAENMNKVFEFYRVINAGSFGEWSANVLEIYEIGLPDYLAFKGTLVTDITTGIKYVKSTGTSLPATRDGWIPVNVPKRYLSVGRGTTTQTISAVDTAILFNTTPNTNMDYNATDGTFFLEAGKQYRITVTAGFDFNVSTGLITLGMYNEANASANGSRAKWISTTHTLNEAQSSVLDFIHNTTTSGRYKIVATVLSGVATARVESTRLVIQEI